jgi:hypothetical protein
VSNVDWQVISNRKEFLQSGDIATRIAATGVDRTPAANVGSGLQSTRCRVGGERVVAAEELYAHGALIESAVARAPHFFFSRISV